MKISKIRGKNIGIDVDGTLCKQICYTQAEVSLATPILENIEKVNYLANNGNFIVIYTARKIELIEVTIKWLNEWGIKYNAISNNKIPLDITIDNDSYKFDELEVK